MKVAFADPQSRVSRLYRADLMGEHDQYEPPFGVAVHEDDDGVRWFNVVAEVGEAFVEEDAYRPYESADDDSDTDE